MFAPIVLFCYNRLDCLKRTVAALQKNELASGSDLFIYSDGPKQGADSTAVYRVRAYLKTITGFRSVHITEAPKNKGLANSIIAGVTEIVNRFGKIIVLEDDLVTSPYFLRFMNDALDMYEGYDKVGSICGFSWQTNKPLPETFFLRGADCWGWATWKRGWDIFEISTERLLRTFEMDEKLKKEFDFNDTIAYHQMLKDQAAGLIDSWAIRWHASMFLSEKMCLYSGRNFVIHIGTDGTHVHSKVRIGIMSNEYFNAIKKIPVVEDMYAKKLFYNAMRDSLKENFLQRLHSFIRRFFFKGSH